LVPVKNPAGVSGNGTNLRGLSTHSGYQMRKLLEWDAQRETGRQVARRVVTVPSRCETNSHGRGFRLCETISGSRVVEFTAVLGGCHLDCSWLWQGVVDQSLAKAYENWDPHDRVPETLLSSAARERGDKQFHDLLDRTLLDPSSFNIEFRSLSKLIQIHRSTDEKVRVFSWEAGGGTGRMVETWAQHTTQICSSCITNTIEAWWLRGEKLMNRNGFSGNSMMIVDDCGGWNPDCTAVFDVPKK
jgi:hypothetical protein